MFLLHINHAPGILGKLDIKKLNLLKKKFINKIVFIKINKLFYFFNKYMQSKKLQKKEKFTKYVIGITLNNSNVNLYLTNVKGQILYCYSSGELGLSRKQKTKKPNVLIKLLKHMFVELKTVNFSFIGVHLKQFCKKTTLPVISMLKNYCWIQYIRVFNNKPHNGCRPRKIKRKKRRFIRFLS